MNIIPTDIEGVVILEPQLFEDLRGHFFESFSEREFAREVCDTVFVQDNEAWSRRGVIRGLHYQLPPYAQSKLVRVVTGRVIDVAVDLRRGSPTFGRHVTVELSGANRRQLFIPRGFAHGYAVLSDEALVQYKCDNFYAPSSEAGLRFDDPALGIDWGLDTAQAIVADRDRQLPFMADARLFDYKMRLYER